MSSLIRVAIADDHQGIIDGYLYRLSGESDIEVVGVAFYGDDIYPLLENNITDVLILDVAFPTARDNPTLYPILHVIPDLLQRYRNLSILIISMHTERTLINEIMKAGAKGYIFKDDHEAIQGLGRVIRIVAEGGVYFSERAFQQWQKRRSSTDKNKPLPTARQLQVLSLCAAYPELTTAKLAEQLGVKPSTIRNLLSDAYRRLGVSNRKSAIAKASQLGLISQPLSSLLGESFI